MRFSPTEVWESKNPWLLEKVELAPDSCGPGRHRGGLGPDLFFTVLEDCWVTAAVERTKTPPWGLQGGLSGRANRAALRAPDGTRTWFGKWTRLKVPKGWTLELYDGGGGGYGPPEERDPEAVREDIREGYVSEEHAREHYPHAFGSE
jgi:N-methylhydantoinase B